MGLECFGYLPGDQIADLYYAKCQDLLLDPSEEQMKRFISFWRLNIKSKKIKLIDWGFGYSWAKIFSNFLSKFDINSLDLRKNKLGNEGIKEMCKGIADSKTLIHIDLGSNDITSEGANALFEWFMNHQYLTSFSLANVDGLHRNRIGTSGWKGLNRLLKENKIISMIDISDNAIGNDGIRYMLNEIDPSNSSIVYINLSNNELSQGWISELSSLLKSTNLYEIKLANNNLSDKTAQELGVYFYRGYCHLSKLDLSYNKLTSVGWSFLFQALKLNPFLTHLNLEDNNLSKGGQFDSIIQLLKVNKILKFLNLSKWELTPNEAEMIADGLVLNTTLISLNLSRNKLFTQGAILILTSIATLHSKVANLDLSFNHIGNEAAIVLSKLVEINTSLQKLNLYSNMLTKSAWSSLVLSLNLNSTLLSINLGWNSIDPQHLVTIKKYWARNLKSSQNVGLPSIKNEIYQLLQSQETSQITEKQIHLQIERCKEEKTKLQNDFSKCIEKYEKNKKKQGILSQQMEERKVQIAAEIESLENQESLSLIKQEKVMSNLRDEVIK